MKAHQHSLNVRINDRLTANGPNVRSTRGSLDRLALRWGSVDVDA